MLDQTALGMTSGGQQVRRNMAQWPRHQHKNQAGKAAQ